MTLNKKITLEITFSKINRNIKLQVKCIISYNEIIHNSPVATFPILKQAYNNRVVCIFKDESISILTLTLCIQDKEEG